MTDSMRIHKALAMAGVASRRAAERMVAEGLVLVNGVVATIGQQVLPTDEILLEGKRVRAQAVSTYLLNKRAGTVSTANDPQGRPTVLDDLPDHVRLYPVGRLDLETTGALLITNDGELAARLMHPSSGVSKVYEVLVDGPVSAESIRTLRRGVVLEDGLTSPAEVNVMDREHPRSTWLRIEISEGRNRQVRRMCEAVGHRVKRLHRPSYAGLPLRGLSRGEWRPLTSEELRRMAKLVGLDR